MGSLKKSSGIKFTKEFFRHHAEGFATLLILLIGESFLAALSILAIVPLVDYLINPELLSPSYITKYAVKIFNALGLKSNFWNFGFLFICVNFLNSCMEILVNFALLRFKYSLMRDLLSRTLKNFLSARMVFFGELNQGQIQNTLIRELDNIGDGVGHIAQLVAQFVRASIYLSIPLFLSPKITLTAVGLALLFGFPLFFLGRISYGFSKLNTSSSNKLMSVMSETLGSARIILGYGLQDQAYMRYLNAYDIHVKATLPSQTLNSAIPKIYKPVAMLAVVVAMGLYMHGEARLSEIAAVMWSLLAAMPSVASMLQANVRIKNFLPSYEQLNSIRELAIKYGDKVGPNQFSQLRCGIKFVGVGFRHAGRRKTLNNVNVFIPKGKMTAIVGESGSGKSTLTDLVLGLQIADEGQVLIDDIPVSEWNLNSFRRKIGYVPQDSQLFHASIKDNLLWCADGASDDEIWLALRLANAEAFVKKLPEGIDTIVGERGLRLSGGQRQRIALARAVLRKPELLILDEATSALDAESERLIQKSVEGFIDKTTILVVAHRMSTIAKSDYIYVLDQGEVVEQGTYAELSERKVGYLKDMLALQ